MNKLWRLFNSNKSVQLLSFFLVNSFFILKYVPRIGINSSIILISYIGLVLVFIILFYKYITRISEKKTGIIYWSLLVIALICIIAILHAVDPYTLRVDRWSALSFFWDSFFQGEYPYGAHTHVSALNFPSPFPFWHYLNLPFYLLGDVGFELLFFLILTAITVKYYFSSYRKSLLFIILLLASPAYWWEVLVRSDGLSNALMVFMMILWYSKMNRSLPKNFILTIFLCGAVASTRFSAILPLFIFFFNPYLQLSTKKKIIFPVSILIVAFVFFSPFIFWDTETWIFFKRNPFMSQTGNGSSYALILLLPLGMYMALLWKNIPQFFNNAATFLLVFMIVTQITNFIKDGGGNIIDNGIIDISYYSLALPYCLAHITTKFKLPEK